MRIRRILDNVEIKAMIRLVNRKDEDQLAPLHYAARYNHRDVVQMLVERKADVNGAGEDGMTPLHFAARSGFNLLMKRGKCRLNKVRTMIFDIATYCIKNL